MSQHACETCNGVGTVCSYCGKGRARRAGKYGTGSHYMHRRSKVVPCPKHTETFQRCDVCGVENWHSDRYLKKTRNAAFRGKRGNESVDYAALTPANKTRHNVSQAAFGALRLLTTNKAQKKIEGGVVNNSNVLPPHATLELFSKKK